MTLRCTRIGAAFAGLVVVTLSLAACGGGGGSATASDKIKTVASTNVWGSVIKAVGGDAVDVHSIIDDPSADPHSYESKPADVTALDNARLAIYNGGGYDDFFAKLLADSGKDAKKIEAFGLSGKGGGDHGIASGEPDPNGDAHAHGSVNEHVWYDLPTVKKVADKAAEELSAIAPAKRDTFAANVKDFDTKIDALLADARKIGTDHPGSKVVATEPVPHYLLETAGIEDVTPAEFSKAIEEQHDVPAAALAQTNDLITNKQVVALVNNSQTENSVTKQLVDRAGAAGVPVAGVTETLPQDASGYVDWMTKQVDSLSSAIGKK
jgi:zinc/manganese transport system substrate-binding protein